MNQQRHLGGNARMKDASARAFAMLFLALLGVTTACGSSTASAQGQAISSMRPRPPASNPHATGFVPNPQAQPAVPVALSGSLPAAVDLSYYNPPVGDQGEVGSCTAWATGYYLRGWYADRDGYYPPSGFSAMYTYAQIAQGADNGSTFAQNLDIQKSQGIDTSIDFVQIGSAQNSYTTQPTDSERTNAARFKIADYVEVSNGFNNYPGGESAALAFQFWIESTLAAGNPITIGIPVYQQLLDASSTNWRVDTPHIWDFSKGSHALFAYGFDRNGLWIENSWGTNWGKNGVAELSWDFVKYYAFEAVSITPPTRPTTWQQLPGTATDISIGANGSVWAIGTNSVYGGYGIYHWNPATWTWNAVDGGAVRVAVDPSGNPWVVNSFGAIFRWTGSAWQQVAGSARDIGIGANGYIWIIGWTLRDKFCRPSPCDGGIYLYNGLGWQQYPGAANHIAANGFGIPWVVIGSGGIYQWVGYDLTGNHWQQAPGAATDIGIGGLRSSEQTPWVIGTDSGVYHWIPTPGGSGYWTPILGSGAAITVGLSGNPWVVNNAGSIFEYGD